MREHVKYDPISLKSFMRYLPLITESVDKKISDMLPDQFAIILDGWFSGSTHFLAVFASFPYNNDPGFQLRLLTFSPLGDECH